MFVGYMSTNMHVHDNILYTFTSKVSTIVSFFDHLCVHMFVNIHVCDNILYTFTSNGK